MIGEIKGKKGVTPVVATVLLIAIVVVVVAIIFTWTRGFIKESVQKKGIPAEQACGQVSLQKSCSDGILSITNIGNIPVYEFNVKKEINGNTILQHSTDFIGIGDSLEFDMGGECPSSYKIIPAILGNSKDEKKIYTCISNEF